MLFNLNVVFACVYVGVSHGWSCLLTWLCHW